jgi:hypothetical protein
MGRRQAILAVTIRLHRFVFTIEKTPKRRRPEAGRNQWISFEAWAPSTRVDVSLTPLLYLAGTLAVLPVWLSALRSGAPEVILQFYR